MKNFIYCPTTFVSEFNGETFFYTTTERLDIFLTKDLSDIKMSKDELSKIIKDGRELEKNEWYVGIDKLPGIAPVVVGNEDGLNEEVFIKCIQHFLQFATAPWLIKTNFENFNHISKYILTHNPQGDQATPNLIKIVELERLLENLYIEVVNAFNELGPFIHHFKKIETNNVFQTTRYDLVDKLSYCSMLIFNINNIIEHALINFCTAKKKTEREFVEYGFIIKNTDGSALEIINDLMKLVDTAEERTNIFSETRLFKLHSKFSDFTQKSEKNECNTFNQAVQNLIQQVSNIKYMWFNIRINIPVLFDPDPEQNN